VFPVFDTLVYQREPDRGAPIRVTNAELFILTMKPLNQCPRCAATTFAGVILVLLAGEPSVVPVLAAAPPKTNIDGAALPRDNHPSTSFAPVIKKVSSSVVNIYTSKTTRLDPALREYLREMYGFDRVPAERRQQSLGSGVIVSEDGYILTNNHVVEGANEVKVALADEKTVYDAKIVGTDPQTDVAVVKVIAENLPAITFADSGQVEVGDVTLAIGDPFGVGQTVTMGIVSAKDRGGIGIAAYEDFIQTDASINPGNSGGALVDAEGRLVGINTAILSRTGGNQGIGFAVPVNLARYVMERIVVDGKVTRGYLGVKIQTVTSEVAKKSKLSQPSGAFIAEVTPGSPGERSGLKAGDVVTEFDGKSVTDSRHFQLMVAEKPPGSQVGLKIIRDGKEQTLSVQLGEMPPQTVSQRVEPNEQEGSE
jgi:serine protease Do